MILETITLNGVEYYQFKYIAKNGKYTVGDLFQDSNEIPAQRNKLINQHD